MKNKFFKQTLILLIGGIITKTLGFIIKIIYTRIMSQDGINLYSLITPTYSLLISIATLSMPLALSKIIGSHIYSSKKVIYSSFYIMFTLNLFIIILMFLLSPFISKYLLFNNDTYYLLIASSLTLPFISLSSCIKGYFIGNLNNLPYAISNVCEQILRLLMIIFILPKFIKINTVIGVMSFILFNIISEVFSCFIFSLFLKNKKILIKDIKPNNSIIKDILNISIPSTSSRLIGNISFFFEPIILNLILLHIGYSSEFIISEYASYNMYAISLLAMPSFFVGAITNSLIPEVSKYYQARNIKMVKKRFRESTLLSFLLGLFFSIFILIFRDSLLSILYHNTSASNYILTLAPFFVLFYIESPIISTIQALGYSKYSTLITLLGVILKNIVFIVLSFFHIGIYGLVIAEIIDIIFVVFFNYKKIYKILKN